MKDRVVRQAMVSDVPEMHRVRSSVRENTLADYSVLTPELYRAHLQDFGRGWVCEHEAQIAGFAIANLREASIWALFVHPSFERQGIGRALHDEMIGWLRKKGLSHVSLDTAANTRAAQFYEAAGWSLKSADAHGESLYELQLS